MKRMSQKVITTMTLVLFLASTFIIPVTTVQGKEEKPKVTTLKVATAFKEGHILADTAFKFKELIEAESKGKIKIEIEAGVDTEEGVNLRCSEGDVDIQITGGEPLEVFAPEYFFFNAPYVIKDYDHFLRVWNGELGLEAQKVMTKNGNMKSLGTVFRGYRQTTSNKPINGVEDLVGLKLRLPGVQSWIDVWSELGANPVAVPLTDLYNSLANGTAEASEGDLTQIQSFNLHEVQTNLAITNHLCAIGWITINEDTYKNDLSRRNKNLVEKCMKEASDWATAKTMDSDNSRLEDLKSKNMTVSYPNTEEMREKAKPVIEELFRTEWPVTTWEEVLAQ